MKLKNLYCRYLLLVIFLLTGVTQGDAVFKERDFGKTIDVLCAELELKYKEQKAIMKQATKDAKKQAKALKKEGWKVAAGSAPMETQLAELLVKERGGQSGLPQYIIGRQEALSGSQGAARTIAISRARNEIAGIINTKVAGILESTMVNVQTSSVDVATNMTDKSTTKQLIDQSLDNTKIILQIYREVNNNTQYQIGMAFEDSMAKEILKKVMSDASAEQKAKAEAKW